MTGTGRCLVGKHNGDKRQPGLSPAGRDQTATGAARRRTPQQTDDGQHPAQADRTPAKRDEPRVTRWA